MAQAYDSGMMARIMPKIQQWEANTGRKITPQMLEAMMKAELSVAADNAARSDAQAKSDTIRQQELDLRKQESDKAASAAKVSGITQAVGTVGQGYLGYKVLTGGPKPVTTPTTTAPAVSTVAPATSSVPAYTGAGSIGYTGGSAATAAPASNYAATGAANYSAGTFGGGAQAAVGSGSTVTPLASSGATTAAAAEGGAATGAAAGGEAAAGTTATGAGTGTATGTGSGVGAGTVAAYATAGYYAHKIMDRNVQPLLEKSMSKREAGNMAHGPDPLMSYVSGHLGDEAEKKYGKTTGDVVQFVLDPIGAGSDMLQDWVDTVICTELRRQERITDTTVRWCKLFRLNHVSDSTYIGYIAWATPVVKQMRKGGVFNRLALPFAHALVRQWVNIAKRRKGTRGERAVYRVAYWASRIAYRLSDERALLSVHSVGVK